MISAFIFSMGPVYARLSGLDTAGVARFMAVSILATVVTQYPIGRLSDRMDRRTMIAAVCTLDAVIAGIITAIHDLPHVVFLALSAVFSKLEPAQMVAASSALLRLNGTSAAVGPVLAGGLMTAFGPRAYFAALAGLTGGLAAYDLWRKMRRKPVPPAQRGPFIGARPQP
jgi:MFS family permease